jgi:hypothetical protein
MFYLCTNLGLFLPDHLFPKTMARRMVQVVECLPSKPEALSSTAASPTIKKKKKKKAKPNL